MATHEDCAGGGDLGGELLELPLCDHQFEVFRGDEIRDFGGILNLRDQNHADLRGERLADLFTVGEGVGLRARGGEALVGEGFGLRHQVELLLAAAVFGLRAEVGRDPLWLRGAVGDDHHFARAGEEVDAHEAEDLAFCFGDEGIARAENLVDRRDRARAEGHRGDGLDAADRVDLADAAEVERGEDVRIDLSVRSGRRAGAEFRDAGDLGGERGHQHRGDERDLAAGNVQAAALDGVVAFADRGAVRVLRRPALGQRAGVEGRDALRSFIESFLFRRIETSGGFLEVLERHADLADRELRVVELSRVIQHRDIPAGFDVSDNRGDGRAHVRGGFARAHEGAELAAEILIARAEEGHGLRKKGNRRGQRVALG